MAVHKTTVPQEVLNFVPATSGVGDAVSDPSSAPPKPKKRRNFTWNTPIASLAHQLDDLTYAAYQRQEPSSVSSSPAPRQSSAGITWLTMQVPEMYMPAMTAHLMQLMSRDVDADGFLRPGKRFRGEMTPNTIIDASPSSNSPPSRPTATTSSALPETVPLPMPFGYEDEDEDEDED